MNQKQFKEMFAAHNEWLINHTTRFTFVEFIMNERWRFLTRETLNNKKLWVRK